MSIKAYIRDTWSEVRDDLRENGPRIAVEVGKELGVRGWEWFMHRKPIRQQRRENRRIRRKARRAAR